MDIAVRAWTEERFAYEGKFHSFPEVMVIPKPVQKPHPPIWMAVTHRWGLFTVGSSFFPASAESDQDLIKLYYSKMRDSGVASQDITIAAVRNLFVAESEEEALEVMKPRLQWAGDMGAFLRRPVAVLAGAGSLRGYEHYASDPFIEPDLLEKRGPQAMSAIGTPEKLNETIRDLDSRHVTDFLGYMDTGGLSYEEIEGSMRLFAEKVMPNFR